MQRQQPTPPSKKIICSINSSSDSSFSQLNPLPHRSNKKSADNELVESIEIEDPARGLASRPRSVVVSQELSVEVPAPSKSLIDEPNEQPEESAENQVAQQEILKELTEASEALPTIAEAVSQSKSQLVSREQPDVKIKRPYTQLVHSNEPNDQISNSQTIPKDDKKGNITLKSVIMSAALGGLAAVGTYMLSSKKLPTAVVCIVVSALTLDTLRKNP